MFTKIIIGDNSAAGGRDAVRLARALAPKADLLLTGVYPYEDRPWRGGLGGYGQILRRDTDAALERTRREGATATTRVVSIADPSPANGLHRRAERDGADLIVVGTSHRGVVGRSLLGDVARGVLHGAPCPVAIAPRGFSSGSPAVIGVAFDGSPEAKEALALAADLARVHGARLVVRYIVENDLAFGGYPMPSLDEIYEDSRTVGQGIVDAAIADLDVPVEGTAVTGSLSEQLTALAEVVDVVVCGSRQFGPVRRVVLGSAADYLIHQASCPVIVAPRSAATVREPTPKAAVAPA